VVYKKDVPTPMQRYGAVIAFNGEIYNWGALRRELEAKGYRFETPTDTEVVLCAYLEWGPACLERMNGMFAVAIWHDERLFLARDRMGKKPLFYAHGPRGLGFASEQAPTRLRGGALPGPSSLDQNAGSATSRASPGRL
jgi:asparagine synthetase B (glutamine-hydrolysing)